MQEAIIMMLIFLPIIFAITLPLTSPRVRSLTSLVYVGFLIVSSIQIALGSQAIVLNFSHEIHLAFIGLDFFLLGYFIYQGLKFKNKLVVVLALLQVVLFGIFLKLSPTLGSYDIIVDQLSRIMLLVVNVVGGIIILYALKYIQSEELKQCKRGLFIGILFFFVGVMNFLVVTNNIELFFLTFELTTLCSYLLIRFRMDHIAVNNALRALWMNQIGGVAILFSLIFSVIYYETYYFDILLLSGAAPYLLPMSFLVIAAMVKGASLPFENWLLGAMVAPTPVSAILHSATMVKIAPFLVLKISGGLSPTLSLSVVLFGSFVFMVASIMALSRDFFKEILGLSTIALLGLMVAIAAIGTVQTQNIVLILIVFHALSKALLFLQAGILEKEFHFKYLSDINTLVSKSKLVVFFIIIGFASLTLPPFGAFMGKFLTIELLATLIEQNPLYLISLVFVLIGSVVLTLLYFKVLTKLLPKDTIQSSDSSIIPTTYLLTSLSLVFLLLYGVFKIYTMGYIGLYELLIPSVILGLSCILLFVSSFKKAHRINEYNCGEKDIVQIQPFYFHLRTQYVNYAKYISIVAFILIVLMGLV